jgi:hypothetical protein
MANPFSRCLSQSAHSQLPADDEINRTVPVGLLVFTSLMEAPNSERVTDRSPLELDLDFVHYSDC